MSEKPTEQHLYYIPRQKMKANSDDQHIYIGIDG